MVQAAHQAARHDGRLKAFFERVVARRGVQKAIVAVARKIFVSIYYVFKRREPYWGEDAGLRSAPFRLYNSEFNPSYFP